MDGSTIHLILPAKSWLCNPAGQCPRHYVSSNVYQTLDGSIRLSVRLTAMLATWLFLGALVTEYYKMSMGIAVRARHVAF